MKSLTAILLIVLAAGTAPAQERDTLGDYLFLVTNDYEFTAGNLSVMEMGPPWAHQDNLMPVCADANAQSYDGLIYVIGRAGCDYVLVLDPSDDFSVVRQFSTGTGSNPQDICFVSPTRAFITRYDTAELWEVDPSTGDHTDTIDLSSLADADGLPEMRGMAVYEDRLYVGLQRLDRDDYWTPVAPSYLAVIDLATNTLVDNVALSATNPSSLLLQDPLSDVIYIGQTGSYGVQDGGIEAFDPASGQTLGFVATEAELGGDLDVWTSADMMRGFAVVLSQSWSTEVVAFDMLTGASLGPVISSATYDYVHLAVDPSYGELYVADANYSEPGIRVFDSESFAPLSGNISIGLYPRWILPVHGPASGLHVQADGAPAARLECWPQPAVGSVTVAFTRPGTGPVDLAIVDAQGRLITTLARNLDDPNRRVFSWDGTGPSGARVPGGVYYVKASAGCSRVTRGIRLLR